MTKQESLRTKARYEFIVGAVVLVSFVIFSIFILMVSGISTVLRPGYHLSVYYDYIHGVTKGSPVKYAGVNAGEIMDMDVVYSAEAGRPQVLVKIFLQEWVDVRERSSIFVRGSTPLSEPHLEIISLGDEEGKPLKSGDRTKGVSPTPIEDLVTNAEVIAQQLKETVTKINVVLNDPDIAADVRAMLHNVAELTAKLNRILETNEEGITESIQHFQKAAAELETVLSELKNGEGSLGRLIGDDELYNELLAFVREIKAHPWRLMKKDGGRKFLFF